MAQVATGVFTEDLAREISESLGEPSWLTRTRLDSFRLFSSLPPETNPLYTKYVSTFDLDVSGYPLSPTGSRPDFRSFFGGYLKGHESDIVLQANETVLHAELGEEAEKAGVRFSPLHEALKSDEAFVKKLFESRNVKSSSDKLAAFVNSFFNGGVVLRVPRGVELVKPLRRMLLVDAPKNSVIDQVFVVAEEESKLVFLEELYSKGPPSESLVASNTEVRAGPAAHIDYSSVQLLDEHLAHVSNRAVDVSNDARAVVSLLSLGGSASRSRMNFLLNGRGSLGEGYEIFFTDGKQRYDFETNLLHHSPDSTGSFQARGVLKGESQSIFKGMIKIVNAAKNSRSYLAHHAMILERTAKSDGIPSLEIDNNEVKATHSASVSQLDEEQLFYLMARGLPLEEAKQMVVLGFFEPVFSRVPLEETREGSRFMIEGKWKGEKRRLADREAFLAASGEAPPQAKPAEDIFERHYKYR
jgi:Fe-S cluster assembly protein SufB